MSPRACVYSRDGDRLERLVSHLHDEFDEGLASMSSPEELMRRCRDVCRFLAEGLTNAEIADELDIETGTVKSHVHDILTTLDIANRDLAGAYWRLFTGGNDDDGSS